jgi:adenine-specific DNA-methyltransferase
VLYDPPYNTETSGFLYKNNYKHSSWMSMMYDRLIISVPLMSDDSSFACHIDENEYERLWNVFEQSSLLNVGTVIWDKRNPMTGGAGLATQHEYVIWRLKI